jgi:hypothetical protein
MKSQQAEMRWDIYTCARSHVDGTTGVAIMSLVNPMGSGYQVLGSQATTASNVSITTNRHAQSAAKACSSAKSTHVQTP